MLVQHTMRKSEGTVTQLQDGRYWARAPLQPDGSRPSLGFCDTREEAEREIALGVRELVKSKKDAGNTFAKFAADILDERELNGIRGIKQERLRFSKHLANAPFANKPLDKITSPDIAEWLRLMGRKTADDKRGKRPLSRQTIQRALSLASVIFEEAGPQERGLVDTNPCLGMKVKTKIVRTDEVWHWLTLEEQQKIATSEAIEETDRVAIMFAIGTGLRAGEQFNLELRDVHTEGEDPHVVVRFGSKGKAPKNGKIRQVPLFGYGLDAARRQIELLKGRPNPHKLLFPARGGGRRSQKPLGNGVFLPVDQGATHVLKSGKPVRASVGATHAYADKLDHVLSSAGVGRAIRWHDLRHTCASSLVQGLWGPAWTLEEVKEMLGHSSILVTQRYAHLGETALKRAAKRVSSVGYELVRDIVKGSGGCVPTAAISSIDPLLSPKVGPPGLEPGTYGWRALSVALRELTRENDPDNQLLTNLAGALAALLDAQPPPS